MKAGIVSINLHTGRLNYGAVLHSWMFQRLMARRGDMARCEILDYLPEAKRQFNPWTHFVRQKRKNPAKLLGAMLITPGFVLRYRRFQQFFKAQLQVSDRCYSRQDLEEMALPYDLIFFESDVIWSPNYFRGSFDPVFFGATAGLRPIPKIAYSASMGEAKLTEVQKDELRELLKLPEHISMRERYASAIVRTLTDKPVADVVDPVLLAEPGDFDPITAPRQVRGKYLLAYYTVNPDPYMLRCVDDYAKAHGLKVVEVSIFTHHKLKHRTFTAAGIEQFLSLVRNAEAVFSNSLHGTCLSILYHREFYAMEHGKGGRKYRDLCEKFGLSDRWIPKDQFTPAAPIDWDRVDALREQYRAESLAWLDGAIKAVQSSRGRSCDGGAMRSGEEI